MSTSTATIASALRILANDIQSPDDVPATCLREAADRLEELQKELDIENKRADGHYENYCEVLKRIDQIANQRDEARAEIERLKAELSNLQPKTTRPDPSRLEIAARLMCIYVAEKKLNSFECIDEAIVQADALIAAAREAK